MAVSAQWAQLLEPGLREIFYVQRDALTASSRIPLLFRQMDSQKAVEHFLGIGGMSDWAEYKGAIEFDDFDQLYKTSMQHKEYVKGFQVSRQLVDDDLYNVINVRPQQLAMSAMRTREIHAATVFTNAFSSSYVGGDGVALCSALHPLAPTHPGSVHGNAGSTALSYQAVIDTRLLMRKFVDDRGELIPIQPDTLLVPPSLEEAANTILKTTQKPDSTDYHANFVSGFLKQIIVWDYLTDTNDWFLLDSQLAKMHLLWIDRVPLEFTLDPTSDFNLVAKFRGYMRYSYGWSDWRWCFGHHV